MTAPKPGWYCRNPNDAADPTPLDWWDGEQWTGAILPNPGAAAAGDGGDDANNTDQLDRQGADEKTATGIASKEAEVEGASGSAAEQRPRRKFGEVLGPKGKKLLLVSVGVSAALLVVLIAAISGGSDQGVQPSDTNDKPALEQTAKADEWPELWCEARVGMSKAELEGLMGPATRPESNRIPQIPGIAKDSPPNPAYSDTWEAAGTYQYNAFISTDEAVQQLDFNGPENEISCDDVRVD